MGSNLGNRAWLLQQALFLIAARAGSLLKISPVYQSPAWGFEGGDFLNLCAAVQTGLGPRELLDVLLGIEKELGRERKTGGGYASRSVDIDILYYGREVFSEDGLEIPHPKIAERAFVLKPLADIAPQFYHPVLKKDSRNLLQSCRDRASVVRTPHKLFPDRTSLFADRGYIAIEGNIGAGKTTLAGMIASDMDAKLILERFADNPFLPKFYEDRARYAFPLEMSFLAERYRQFTEDTRQLDLFKRFMISDYDIYKSLIFARITLQQDEFLLYRKLFNLMYKEVRKPRLYVYLYQHTDRLLEQIARRGRPYEQEIPADYLEQIHRGYFDFMKNSPELNSLVIDVSGCDFVENPGDYHRILDQMSAAILEQGDVKI
nr:2-amino-4-hydroxy-6-hydroxymethyldihydropteridine diphosphokinase [Robiginitalea sp. SC105]